MGRVLHGSATTTGAVRRAIQHSQASPRDLPPRYADGPTARYLTHMFDLRCAEHGIEHRFTRINHPWTTVRSSG